MHILKSFHQCDQTFSLTHHYVKSVLVFKVEQVQWVTGILAIKVIQMRGVLFQENLSRKAGSNPITVSFWKQQSWGYRDADEDSTTAGSTSADSSKHSKHLYSCSCGPRWTVWLSLKFADEFSVTYQYFYDFRRETQTYKLLLHEYYCLIPKM